MKNSCFKCGEKGEEFYGYTICNSCKNSLRLFSDKTIKKHIAKFTKTDYKNEIESRIDFIKKDFISKKIKLKYLRDKIETLG
jgi:arsenate reductase-like glutaredoxin family protein